MSKSWKEYKKLRQKKYREEWRLFIAEGIRLCREALLSDWEVEAAFVSKEFTEQPAFNEFREYFLQRKITHRLLGSAHFQQLSDTETPQGILLVMRIPEGHSIENIRFRNKKFILLIDGIRDPGNMGTLLRTADWFGVDLVISSPDSVDFFSPKVVRASMGSIFHLPVVQSPDLPETVKLLQAHNFLIIATAVQSRKKLEEAAAHPPLGLVLGGEAQGVSPRLQQMANRTVQIRKFGEAESLNVAVAGGIVLHHFARQVFRREKK